MNKRENKKGFLLKPGNSTAESLFACEEKYSAAVWIVCMESGFVKKTEKGRHCISQMYTITKT